MKLFTRFNAVFNSKSVVRYFYLIADPIAILLPKAQKMVYKETKFANVNCHLKCLFSIKLRRINYAIQN